MPSWNACASIQSFILRRCASASSSGLPANFRLKCDQFNCGICCIGSAGIGWLGGIGSCTEGAFGAGACGAGGAGGAGRACGLASAIVGYIFYRYNINMHILWPYL